MSQYPTPDPSNPTHAAALERMMDAFDGNGRIVIPFTAPRLWNEITGGDPHEMEVLMATVAKGIEMVATTMDTKDGRQIIHSWFTDEEMGGDYAFVFDVEVRQGQATVLVLGPISRKDFLGFFPDLEPAAH